MHTIGPFIRKQGCWILLAAIVLAAGFLRFYHLGTESLWADEIASWQQSHTPDLATAIRDFVSNDTHPPLYQSLLYFLEKHIGGSEAALRFPSAAAGLLAVPCMFLLGRRLYGAAEGLFAAALTAVLWAPVYYSQEARSYSLLFLFSIVTTYFWVPLAVPRPGRPVSFRAAARYAAAGAVLAYTHYFGLYLLALQALYLLYRSGFERRQLFMTAAVYGLVAASYLPWLSTLIFQVRYRRFNVLGWLDIPSPLDWYSFLAFVFNQSLFIAALASGVYVLYILKKVLRRTAAEGWSDADSLTAYLALAPFAGIYLVSLFWYSLYEPRYLLIAAPAVILFTARALLALRSGAGWRFGIASAVVLALALHLIFGLRYYAVPHKPQWRAAVDFAARQSAAYPDLMIIGWSVGDENFFNYYFDRLGFPVRCAAAFNRDPADVLRLIEERKPRHIGLIAANVSMPELPEGFSTFARANLRQVAQRSFHGAEVKFYEVTARR